MRLSNSYCNHFQERLGEVIGCSVSQEVCMASHCPKWGCDYTAQIWWGIIFVCAALLFQKSCLPFPGSGIYAPHSPKEYHYDMKTDSGKLLIAEVDSQPQKSPDYPAAVNWNDYAKTIKPFPVQKTTFGGNVSRDQFNFTELFENSGNLTVCQKELCCHLSYKMLEKKGNETYVLGAFTGLHGRRQREYWQVI